MLESSLTRNNLIDYRNFRQIFENWYRGFYQILGGRITYLGPHIFRSLGEVLRHVAQKLLRANFSVINRRNFIWVISENDLSGSLGEINEIFEKSSQNVKMAALLMEHYHEYGKKNDLEYAKRKCYCNCSKKLLLFIFVIAIYSKKLLQLF